MKKSDAKSWTVISCREHLKQRWTFSAPLMPSSHILNHSSVICHSVRCNQPIVFFSHQISTNHQPASSIFFSQQISTSHQLQPAEQSNSTCIWYTEQMGGLIIQTDASHNLTNFMCTASPLDLNMTSIFGKVSENQTLQKFFQTESKFSDACSVFILATSSTESCLTYNGTRLWIASLNYAEPF